MTRIFLYSILLLNISSICPAQTTFQKLFARNNFDYGEYVCNTSDGGCIVIGRSFFDETLGQTSAIKLDSFGNFQWSKVYGSPENENIRKVRPIGNGFLACGVTEDVNADQQIFLLRCDSTGDTLWTSVIDNPGDDYVLGLIVFIDGSSLIYGKVDTALNESYLLRLNSSGNFLWEKKIVMSENFLSSAFNISSDGNIFISGRVTDTLYSCALIKLSPQGAFLWAKKYNNYPVAITIYSMAMTSDGGCILTGAYGSSVSLCMMRINQYGDKVWTRLYDAPKDDILFSIIPTSDGNFIGTGYHLDVSEKEVLIFCFDENGDTLFTNVFGRSGLEEEARSIIEASDGGFYIIGSELDFPNMISKMYLAKTDHQGKSHCQDRPAQFWDLGPVNFQTGVLQVSVTGFAIAKTYNTIIIDSGMSVTTICNSIGVPEIGSIPQLQIFPNPSSRIFHLSFSERNVYENLVIYNSLGEIVFQRNMNREMFLDVDLSANAQGIYTARFESENQYQTARVCLIN